MIVINSSPAINLTAILGDLGLLVELYGSVIVPHEVFSEWAAGAGKDLTAEKLRLTPGIDIREQPIFIPSLLGHALDLGESAVIQTALQDNIPAVILDDLKARLAAVQAGLEVTGSLGVLVQAKKVGRLASVATAVDQLRRRGTGLHPNLVKKALDLAGESPTSSFGFPT